MDFDLMEVKIFPLIDFAEWILIYGELGRQFDDFVLIIGCPVPLCAAPCTVLYLNSKPLSEYPERSNDKQLVISNGFSLFFYWTSSSPTIKIGDLVLLIGMSSTSTDLPLGRIVGLFPGPDGITRVVSVNTSRGIYKRPLSKLVLLP